MKRARPKQPNWSAMERARIARDRDNYRNSTPGERVERMLEASRLLTATSSAARARR